MMTCLSENIFGGYLLERMLHQRIFNKRLQSLTNNIFYLVIFHTQFINQKGKRLHIHIKIGNHSYCYNWMHKSLWIFQWCLFACSFTGHPLYSGKLHMWVFPAWKNPAPDMWPVQAWMGRAWWVSFSVCV